MEIPKIVVIYQTEPIIAAVCPEFNVRLTNLRDFDDLEERVASEIKTRIERERAYYAQNQKEIRKNLQKYKRIKALHKDFEDIEEFEAQIQYEQTTKGKVADKFGFKQ